VGRAGTIVNQKFALFAEMALTGILVALGSLGLITALPATIAGAAHLRRFVAGEAGGRAAVFGDFRTAFRRLPLLSIGLPVLAVLLYWNTEVCRTTNIAGARGILVASIVIAVALVITVVRLMAWWSAEGTPGSWAALREAAQVGIEDPNGSFLLALAVIGSAAVSWMLPPLVMLAPGLLVLASLAVERRRLEQVSEEQ
jgi:uncharacterized membrane protein YesL